MSVTAILVDAFTRAKRDVDPRTTLVCGLLATSRLRNALAPRISAACALTDKMFDMVAAAPTAWCAAHLRLDSPTAAVLQQTPAAFVQLQSISVLGDVLIDDIVVLAAMPASLNQCTLREIEFGNMIAVTDAVLRGLASVTARLETLIIRFGCPVTEAGLASLRGTPMIATLRKFTLIGSYDITDDGVAAVLGSASELRSLTLTQCTRLSGAFLTQLHEHCHDSLAEIDLNSCTSIDNAGAAALSSFRGLTELGLSDAVHLSVLPLECLPRLCAVKIGFLSRCSSLTALDLSRMTNVSSVGRGFLNHTDSLTRLRLSDALLKSKRLDRRLLRLHETTADSFASRELPASANAAPAAAPATAPAAADAADTSDGGSV